MRAIEVRAPDGTFFHSPGTRGRYVGGCRCFTCTDANTAYHRTLTSRLALRDIPPHLHGTVTAYSNWRCRCVACVAFNAQRCRDYRKKRRNHG